VNILNRVLEAQEGQMKLSIIIPLWNEEKSIRATLKELEGYMNNYNECSSWEIIAVNDGSTDNTLAILNNFKEGRTWLKVIDHGKNYGRGRALRTGFEQSTGDVIVSIDADLSYAPYHIERLLNELVKNNADIVLASAYGKGGTVKNAPFLRLLLSRLGNKILSHTFGRNVSVLTCVVRAYKKSFIDKLDLHSNDKELYLEILLKAKILGATILEVPADLKWRDEKIPGLKKTQKRRSSFKLRKTSSSHFFFALLNKPGIIFFIPANILLLISLFILTSIIGVVLVNISSGLSLYLAIRESMLSGALSYLTFALSFVLSIQFFTLGFLTNQNKKNYEEIYKTINTILVELKKKE
jgi:glycosyltransferase involved in cell wall biosynthesis